MGVRRCGKLPAMREVAAIAFPDDTDVAAGPGSRRSAARPWRRWRAVVVVWLAGAVGAAGAVVTAGDPAAIDAAPRPPGWPAPDLAAVARLGNGCSAVLLAGERHLLGAAHCAGEPGMSVVLGSGERLTVAARVSAPGWAGQPAVHDLAVMTLQTPAVTPGLRLATPAEVEAAGAVLVAGWGAGGTPRAPEPAGTLRYGYNEYDAVFTPPGWTGDRPEGGPVRLFDFDDGSFGANILGLRPGGRSSLGLGPAEAMLAGLDSGGPSLVPVRERAGDWLGWLRGDTVWTWRIAAIHVGIDGRRGGGFGGLGLDLLVAPYADWIAQVQAAAGAGRRLP